jgi:hypothetical protein
MKYRFYALIGLLALSAGAILQAQDYDDIYYDASKSSASTKAKVAQPAKTVAVYGEVPERYKEAVQVNYSTNRDVDEYNRRGAYDPSNMPAFEVDINGDTIYFDNDSIYDDEAFANTRRIERFYNPDVVILSDDDDLVELYYSETPTINLIVGSDWGYDYYDWGFYSSYYPWYTGWYVSWGWYSPWRWRASWYYGYRPWGWSWGYHPWYYSSWSWGWGRSYWDWGHRPYWGWSDWNYAPNRHNHTRYADYGARPGLGQRAGLATNRNNRGRVDAMGSNRNNIGARGASSNRGSSVGGATTRSRGGYATSRGGNMGSRSNSGVVSRSSGSVSRSPSSSGSRSYGGSSSSSRSSGSSYSGSRSSGSYSSGSSRSSGSYSSGSSGGGSRGGGGGGGSTGGSSGSRRH